MNYKVQGQEICTLLRFYGELVKFIIGPNVLVIGPFSYVQIYFRYSWIIWYDIFSNSLGENDCLKMNL